MKILLTGATGQLGISLQRQLSNGFQISALSRHQLDISSELKVMEAVSVYQPDWIINAAAYTAVDKAESNHRQADATNHLAVKYIARAAESHGARMLHISTDYVFDGNKVGPYQPDDATNPINIYGKTKLAGENAARQILGEKALILRTAWVYSGHGHNFFNSMLRLMGERDVLKVVEDQVGTPTSTTSLAEIIRQSLKNELSGTHHWTDAGVASWYDFACEIRRQASKAGLLSRSCSIEPIPTSAYPTPAKRPQNSQLDKQSLREALGCKGKHWSECLADEVSMLKVSSV